MNLAFITYEYPPEIAKGGIATYTNQIARIMSDRGHQVYVFCASAIADSTVFEDKVWVYRVKSTDPDHFSYSVVPVFSKVHETVAFDLLEVPEIHANGAGVKLKFPDLALVVRLHLASFIQKELMRAYVSPWIKFRFWFGNLRRGKWQTLSHYRFEEDKEYRFTKMADGISSPSFAQKERIVKAWKISPDKVAVIPNPFDPDETYLKIPIETDTKNEILSIGKLSTLKGIVSLVEAIPLVLKNHPDAHFTLIGDDSHFTGTNMMMSEFIRRKLKQLYSHVTLVGGVSHEEIPQFLSRAAICVFPSLWESFGLVCLEAMSAGRMVIGSRNGGMSEILSEGAGETVDPGNSREIAEKISQAIADKKMRFQYGERGREKAISKYNGSVVGAAMESFYLDVIRNSGRQN